MGAILQDTRVALRGFARSPGLVTAVCLSLGLSAGANTTVVSWIESLVLDPYPQVADAGRLVALNVRGPDGDDWPISYPILREWERGGVFQGVAGWAPMKLAFRRPAAEGTRPVYAMLVSGSYFEVLGVTAPLGTTFRREHEHQASGVAVVSDLFWRREMDADPQVVGSVVLLGGEPFTVLGVAPPDFFGTYLGANVDLWVPLTVHPRLTGSGSMLEDRGARWLQGFARLRPGTTRETAGEVLSRLTLASSAAAGDRPVTGALVRRLRDQFLGSLVTPLLTLLLAVTSLVLLVACANLANLLLARAVARSGEMALRRALGASRPRLLRLALVESALLGLAGSALGVAVAFAARNALVTLIPPAPVPVILPIRLDGRVMLIATAVGVVAVLLFGTVPALRASAVRAPRARGASGGRGRSRTQDLLVVSQVALSLTSLLTAGLFLRSLSAARSIDIGITDPSGIFVVNTSFDVLGPDTTAAQVASRRLLHEVRALPGVEGAALSTMVPLGFGGHRYADVSADGYVASEDEDVAAEAVSVSDGYFETLGIRMVAGRGIDESDRSDAAPVVVVNEAFARRFWPGADALGREVDQGSGSATVIGVAEDGRYRDLDDHEYMVAYWPLEQWRQPSVAVQVRLATPGRRPTDADMRAAFRRVAPDLPFDSPRSLEEHMKASTFVQRVAATMIAAFALLSLSITTVGLHGLVAYRVACRTREVGVRVALGAERREIVSLVLREAVVLGLSGLATGAPLALLAGAAVRAQLLGVGVTDPVSFGAAAGTIFLVTLAAACGPALRASAVSPVRALGTM